MKSDQISHQKNENLREARQFETALAPLTFSERSNFTKLFEPHEFSQLREAGQFGKLREAGQFEPSGFARLRESGQFDPSGFAQLIQGMINSIGLRKVWFCNILKIKHNNCT